MPWRSGVGSPLGGRRERWLQRPLDRGAPTSYPQENHMLGVLRSAPDPPPRQNPPAPPAQRAALANRSPRCRRALVAANAIWGTTVATRPLLEQMPITLAAARRRRPTGPAADPGDGGRWPAVAASRRCSLHGVFLLSLPERGTPVHRSRQRRPDPRRAPGPDRAPPPCRSSANVSTATASPASPPRCSGWPR